MSAQIKAARVSTVGPAGGLDHVHAGTFAGEYCGWVLTRQFTAHKGTFCSCHSVFFLLPSVCLMLTARSRRAVSIKSCVALQDC